jgi:hypothetical protein
VKQHAMNADPHPKPRLAWTADCFNCFSAFAGKFRLSVEWDSMVSKGTPTGYRASFEDVRLKTIFQDVTSAQLAAEKLARKKLALAVAALGDITE